MCLMFPPVLPAFWVTPGSIKNFRSLADSWNICRWTCHLKVWQRSQTINGLPVYFLPLLLSPWYLRALQMETETKTRRIHWMYSLSIWLDILTLVWGREMSRAGGTREDCLKGRGSSNLPWRPRNRVEGTRGWDILKGRPQHPTNTNS